MAWLYPLWLAAIAAVAIPLIIHLERRRTGRRILVGSVRHLAAAPTPRARRLKIRDPWLLLLRAAILALIAMGLAEPMIRAAGSRPERWTLIAPGLLADSAYLHAPLIDSLRSAGTPVRLLAPGFPGTRLSFQRAGVATPADLWSLLADAARQLHPGSDILVVVPASLALVRGTRPAVPATITIRALPVRGDSRHIEAAWTHGDSLDLVVATAHAGGVTSERRGIALPAADTRVRRDVALGDATLHRSDRGWTVRLGADSLAAARADTMDLPSPEDPDGGGRYLDAALRAGAETFGVPLRTRPHRADAFDIVLPKAGDPRVADDVLRGERGELFDAFGRPLVSRPAGEGYALASRLGPRSGNFVLRPAFPDWITRALIAPRLGITLEPRRETRSIALAQMQPGLAAARPSHDTGRPLRAALLALAALLFIAERLLAQRRRR